MDHDDRVKRVLVLVADIKAYPDRYALLPIQERLIVGVALGRIDWLKADGVDSIVQARDRIGIDWSRAVSAARWKT